MSSSSGPESGLAAAAPFPPRLDGRRRDRRGRGIRGPLIPPGLPGARTRAEWFEWTVRGEIARLERRWSKELERIEVAIEDVPVSDPASWEERAVPLARAYPRRDHLPAHIVLYRRPIESRAYDPEDLAALVLDLLVEQVARLLGRDPHDIDPEYHGWE